MGDYCRNIQKCSNPFGSFNLSDTLLLLLIVKLINPVKMEMGYLRNSPKLKTSLSRYLDGLRKYNFIISQMSLEWITRTASEHLQTTWEDVSSTARAWKGPRNEAIDAKLYRLGSTPWIAWEMNRSGGQRGEHRYDMSREAHILQWAGGHSLVKLLSPGGPANKASCHKAIAQYKASALWMPGSEQFIENFLVK